MKRLIIFLLLILAASPLAMAQQDPDDPGIQDSIIIGSVYVDTSAQFVGVPLYVVTDDSVGYFHMAIHYAVADTNIRPRLPHNYFPPIIHWDEDCDTVYWNEQYLDFCWMRYAFDEPPLITNGFRVQIMTLAFNIARGVQPQLVVLDTIWNPIAGSIEFCIVNDTEFICFTPAYQRGFIAIGPGVDVEDNQKVPTAFSLSQNYPNPFNA